ncbi:class I lanthipeptide, partial [Pedobacter sp.]
MKKKFKFSLDLNKETVSELTKKQQRTIFGGETDACGPNSAG